jgi:streptogramin lyase
MFQIQNKSDAPSPWIVYPESNKTVWIVTLELGKTLLSQIVNFTMVTPSFGISTVVANLSNTVPTDIVYDHVAGRLWIVENNNLDYYNQTAGSIMTAQTFPNGEPQYLAIDSQDHLWLTLYNTDQIVEYEPQNGATSYYSTPSSNAGLQGIAVSPVDGSIWFVEAYSARIGHLVPCSSSACPIAEYSPPPGINLEGIIQVAVDKNGVVWFTHHDGNEFGSFNPSTGEWKLFPIGYCSDNYVDGCEAGLPNAIAIDSTGQVWFSEHYAGRIARYDPGSGTLTEYMMPTTSAVCSEACTPYVWWMWPGENGLVWFVAFGLGEIGYVNASLAVPFDIVSPSQVVIPQAGCANIVVSSDYTTGLPPNFNGAVTSEDSLSNPSMIKFSGPQFTQASNGIASSILTVFAGRNATTSTSYVAVSAYDVNVTVSAFVSVEVVNSTPRFGTCITFLGFYTTVGFASGISGVSAIGLVMNVYPRRRRDGPSSAGDPEARETKAIRALSR